MSETNMNELFFAKHLQLQQLLDVAAKSGIYVPSRERQTKLSFATFLLANGKGDLLKDAFMHRKKSTLDRKKKLQAIRQLCLNMRR